MVHVGGTEAYLLTVGEHLQRLGHEVVIYAPELGPYGDHVRRCGIEVVGEMRELPADCDVVLAQDTIVAYDMAQRYPPAQQVYRVCGDSFDFQLPPQLDGVVNLIVVLSDRYARVTEACAAKAPILRMRVPIDIDRLVPIGTLRARPRRAVMLGNYPDRFGLVREAWGQHGVEVLQVGNLEGTRQSYDVAHAVADADIVVAKARAALDAMACGRAVYIYDMFGGDGWVTPDLYPALEADNFAGQATGRVIGVAELEHDIGEYDARMGIANRDLILQHHNARYHVMELLAAIDNGTPSHHPVQPMREIARLTALLWSWEQAARNHQGTAREIWERLVRAEQSEADALQRAGHAERERAEALQAIAAAELARTEALRAAERATRERLDALAHRRDLEQDLAEAANQLASIRKTRAWRLATLYWGLKEFLRPSSR